MFLRMEENVIKNYYFQFHKYKYIYIYIHADEWRDDGGRVDRRLNEVGCPKNYRTRG